MARQVASLFGVLRLDDSDYKNKLGAAQRDTQSLGQSLQAQGQNLQQLGAGMTAFFAPVAVALGYAVTQGQTFDRTMSNINSILQLGAEDAATLRAELLAVGSGTVAGPQAVAEAYYEIVSGVADATTHMAILNAAIATSEAGQANLQATTSALISTMNAYGFAASDAAYVSDVFTRTVAMGVLTMDELAAAFPLVTGLGAQFGIGIDELGGSMAYLTAQGYSASQSATFMRAMITTLLNPTAELQAAIEALGYESGAALLEAEGLTGAYLLLSQQNGGLDGLITNTEALNGALVLTNDGAQAFMTTYTEGIDGATARSGDIQNQTEQWLLLKSQLDALAIQVSSVLMPILLGLVTDYIAPTITAVQGWIQENPQLTQGILLITMGLIALGPIIGGIGTLMTIAGGAIGVVSMATGGLTLALAVLTSPLVAVGAIVAGLVWAWNQPGGWIGTLHQASVNASALVEQLNTIVSLLNNDKLWEVMTGQEGTITGTHVDPANWAPRAGGGDVEAGGTYMVGENGPEKFVPSVSGTIVPNEAMGQGGDTYHVNVYANSEEEGRAAARGFNDELLALRRSRGVTLNG
jgi:TP901 family phage tail tape measure protein